MSIGNRRRRPSLAYAGLVQELEERMLLTAYVVDTLNDTVAADGKISLREAIQAANTNAPLNDAPAGQGSGILDTVTFHPSLTGSGPASITLSGFQLEITDRLAITGPGASLLTVSGDLASRVFFVSAGASLAIADVTISGGDAGQDSGSGINNGGILVVANCVLSGNGGRHGSGIANTGTATITNSTVSDNTGIYGIFSWSGSLTITNSTISGNESGGILNYAPVGTLTVSNSTISGNHGPGIDNAGNASIKNNTVSGNIAAGGAGTYNAAGGIYNSGAMTLIGSTISGNSTLSQGGGGGILNRGTLLISNSTISGNAAFFSGGGILSSGTATLRNTTVYGNVADSGGQYLGGGGGIAVQAGTFTLDNTIVSGNRTGRGAATDIYGTVAAASSYNFVTSAGSSSGLTNGVNGNIVGLVGGIDHVLRDNGGPTKTHALLPRSPAIDAGNNLLALAPDGSPLMNDQRGAGFPRVQRQRVDIGALESTPVLEDLVAYHEGGWYVGVSDGSSFSTTQWDAWGDVAWDALLHGDFNGDGRSDVLGVIDSGSLGEFFGVTWYVGLSTGSSFSTRQWGIWTNLDFPLNLKNVTVGDLDGDGKDDIMARIGGRWWAALSRNDGFTFRQLWARWADVDWTNVSLVDLDGDGRDDLLGYYQGEWWAALTNVAGGPFAKLWDRWADVPYDAIGTFDADGDGRRDLFGLYHGDWYVSRSIGSAFTTSLRDRWANIPWKDAIAGDFNRDGRDDLAARDAGRWWVSVSSATGGSMATTQWATWENLNWQDVRTGDFDGDRRDDLAARVQGQWYVGRSTGTSFSTSRWGGWADVAWQAVAVAETDGPPPVASSSATFSAQIVRPIAGHAKERSLALFWASVRDDDEFAAALHAAA